MIRVENPESCSGCRLCSLACSFHQTPEREFSLEAAHIRVGRVGHEVRFEPVVTDECTGCGLCVPFCAYGVLAEA